MAGGSNVYTDDNLAYRKMQPMYKHGSTTHSMGEYVKGSVHTNSIENFWLIFKRGYIGIYHYMSKKNLQRFINEFVFRYNYMDIKSNKKKSVQGVTHDRFKISIENIDGNLPYKKLINA